MEQSKTVCFVPLRKKNSEKFFTVIFPRTFLYAVPLMYLNASGAG